MIALMTAREAFADMLPRPHEYVASTAVSSDGVKIAVQSWGNRRGPAIVFIHGFAQSGLAFVRQLRDDRLAAKYHLVTYDLRGHGASDKPSSREAYHTNKLWADDLRAVLTAVNADRPVLVAWSLGGRVVWDYLAEYGEASVAGAQLVGSAWFSRPEWKSTVSAANLPLMLESDLATNIAGTTAFLASCFATPPPADEFAQMLAYNMVQPPEVRRLLVGRKRQSDEFIASLTLPVVFVVGEKDLHSLPQASRASAERMKGATALEMRGVGHSPFYEDAAAFDAQLEAFAERAFARAGE